MYQSRDRQFAAYRPVLWTTAYVFHSSLSAHKAFKEYARQLLFEMAPSFDVHIEAYAFLDSHMHLLLYQEFDGHQMRESKGIAAFSQRFKSRLGIRLTQVCRKGSKFEGRYHSVNLHTFQQYCHAYAYVVGQAVRHGADPTRILTSQTLLHGGVDGVIRTLPRIYRPQVGLNRRQMARRFGGLIRRVITLAEGLANGERAEIRPKRQGLAAQARARRQRATDANPRDTRLHQRRMARCCPEWEHWREATQVTLWNDGIDTECPTTAIRRLDLSATFPKPWAARVRELEAWRMPGLDIVHEMDDAGHRVLRTIIIGDDETAVLDWALRLEPGRRPP